MWRCRIVACRHNREEASSYQTWSWSTSPQICLCHRQRFPVGINSEPVEHGLQLVMDIGQQRGVISKQHFWDSKIWNISIIRTDETRHCKQPSIVSEQYSCWFAFASLLPDPHQKHLCIHWVVQNTNNHPFCIHAGSDYTFCVIFFDPTTTYHACVTCISRGACKFQRSLAISFQLAV